MRDGDLDDKDLAWTTRNLRGCWWGLVLSVPLWGLLYLLFRLVTQ